MKRLKAHLTRLVKIRSLAVTKVKSIIRTICSSLFPLFPFLPMFWKSTSFWKYGIFLFTVKLSGCAGHLSNSTIFSFPNKTEMGWSEDKSAIDLRFLKGCSKLHNCLKDLHNVLHIFRSDVLLIKQNAYCGFAPT